MQKTEQALISFFERVAQKDKSELHRLKQDQHFSVNQKQWSFTLPKLFDFLQLNDKVFSNLEYKQFRQLIFNSSINKTVKLYGAEITITDNQSNVDLSGYALVWQAKQQKSY